MKFSSTAWVRAGLRVNASRDQSRELPRRLSWDLIVAWYLACQCRSDLNESVGCVEGGGDTFPSNARRDRRRLSGRDRVGLDLDLWQDVSRRQIESRFRHDRNREGTTQSYPTSDSYNISKDQEGIEPSCDSILDGSSKGMTNV